MNDYLVIDIETSGLDEKSNEIIRLSALKIKNGKIARRFSSFCKPEKLLEKPIETITGITNADLENKSAIIDLLPDFMKFVGGDTIVAHNVSFDVKFINAALKKADMLPLKNETVDILTIARNNLLLQKYTLKHIAEFLGICGNTDGETTFQVYEKLKTLPERLLTANEMSYLEDLWQNANRYDISAYVRQRCFQTYFDELKKIPFEDIESLCGEELEMFNLSMALDWVKIQGGDGNDQEKMSEKYEQYLKRLSKTDSEYAKRVASVRGDCRKIGRY